MGLYRKASKDPFPVEFLLENWKNSAGQLSFLKLAVAAPPDMFNLASTSRRIDAEGLPTVGKSALHQSWYSLALIETLLHLAEVESYSVVRTIFNYPIKHCPELLCIGLAQATKVGKVHEILTPFMKPISERNWLHKRGENLMYLLSL